MIRVLPIVALVTLAGLLARDQAAAARVKVFHQHKQSHYEAARFKNAVINNTGALRLARKLRPLASLEASHVWALAEDSAGNVFAATGGRGKIFKITPAGKASVVYTGDQGQILSLITDAKGETLYAGTGPHGKIIRLDQKGQAKVLCELPVSYVWSLALDPKSQTLYAATGPKGKIYSIAPTGKFSVLYDTKQEHVLCLAAGTDGSVFAGTDRTGRVYRIKGGKGYVLFQAPQSEVRTLSLVGETLYAGTSGTKKRTGSKSTTESNDKSASLKIKPSAVMAAAMKETRSVAVTKKTASAGKSTPKGKTASAPSAPASGENSLWRIGLDGTVREVFRKKALILGTQKVGKRFYIGTGVEGKVFEVDEATKEYGQVARLDQGQVLCLLKKRDGSLVVGTGDPGKLFVLEDRFAAKGTVLSEVLDAKLTSKWGALRWRATTPAKTKVSVAVRGGNTSEPDDTWTDWSDEETDGDEGTMKLPAARFVQYRVTLQSDDSDVSPVVKSISLRYATANQAPEITRIDVPDLDAENAASSRKIKLTWKATDANEDELTYSVYAKKDGWKNWVKLSDDLTSSEYEWDTTTTPSGTYRIKIVASDRASNPRKEALSASRISAPFIVCHTAPTVSVKTAGVVDGKMRIEATASSPLVRLKSASWVLNGKKWINVFPKDELFDSKRESFEFTTEKLKPGTYVLVLQVKDAAGNTGSGDVVFTVPETPVARK